MSALAAATTTLRLAEAALARVEHERHRANERVRDASARILALETERDSGACEDLLGCLAELDQAHADEDAAERMVREVERLIPEARFKHEKARSRYQGALAQHAAPEAARLAAEAASTLTAFAAAQRASLDFRRTHSLSFEGAEARYPGTDHDLDRVMFAAGLDPRTFRLLGGEGS